MSIAGVVGLLFGGLVGLVLRPVLDSYLQWRHARAARDEIPTYPSLYKEKEPSP